MPPFRSEILSKAHMAALNGAPFWVIKKNKAKYEGSPHYEIWYIKEYSYANYPIIDIKMKFKGAEQARMTTGRFTMALMRQLREESRNEESFALWDLEELKQVIMLFKLKGLVFKDNYVYEQLVPV